MNTMIKTTRIKNSVYYKTTPVKDAYSGYLYKQLSAEGCEDFYNYIDWLDLVKDLNVIVLPKTNYYYYIQEDLKNTKTLINLKPLNRIKDVKSFLENIFSILPDYSFLTGCYDNNNIMKPQVDVEQKYMEGESDKNNSTGNDYQNMYKDSWLYNRIKRIFNSGANRQLTKTSTISLMKEAGFTVLDITGLNGRTYFCVQKRPSTDI